MCIRDRRIPRTRSSSARTSASVLCPRLRSRRSAAGWHRARSPTVTRPRREATVCIRVGRWSVSIELARTLMVFLHPSSSNRSVRVATEARHSSPKVRRPETASPHSPFGWAIVAQLFGGGRGRVCEVEPRRLRSSAATPAHTPEGARAVPDERFREGRYRAACEAWWPFPRAKSS